MEYIQNEKCLKPRHKQTELEIYSYIFSDHKLGLLLYVDVVVCIYVLYANSENLLRYILASFEKYSNTTKQT